jgi:hypothetical protein
VADLAVVCYQWNNGFREYLPRHVDVLANMVKRNLPIPHRFVCITDESGFGPLVETFTLPAEAREAATLKSPEGDRFPSSFRRLWTFSEAARAIADRILLLDIDCIVVRDLRPLLAIDADFVGWEPNSAWGRQGRLGGGTWLLKTGTRTDVWTDFGPRGAVEARAAGFRGSDQAWLSYKLAGRVPVWPKDAGIFQAQDLKMSSYRRMPAGARIVHFNGDSKPWMLASRIRWIRDAWQ